MADRRPSRARTAGAVVEELATAPSFVEGAKALADELDRDPTDVLAEARACVAEMATVQRRLPLVVWARWARFLWARAYELDVDREGLDRVRALGRDHPLVFLPSHKSNLDGYIMAALLRAEGFPANHVLGGINMAFWPLGPLGRRVGVIWIRRSFGGDEIYKFALRRYLAHLVGQRRSLEWYIEGGRSRTGKLLPPKMGLLNYLARGVEETGIDDVALVPVSLVYDRLDEVVQMTAESRGATKRPESVVWLARYAYAQRSKLGRVQVRFGEPVPLPSSPGEGGQDRTLVLSKVAFEVCTRVNRATPVTSTSLATLALLGADGWAVTVDQAIGLVEPLQDYIRRRGLPGVQETAELETRAGMARVLGRLADAGVVETFPAPADERAPEGVEAATPVHRISPERELAAAFYRNMVIHWFVNRAIVELSLVAAAEHRGRGRPQMALDEAFKLRDLLKFEFFFADKAEFEDEMRAELQLVAPRWEEGGAEGLEHLGASLGASGGLLADRILRSFLEAYWVVADRLVDQGDTMVETDALLASCLTVGRQYHLQRRIVSGEAISTELFSNAVKLAANRGLLDHDNLERAPGRLALARELHEALRRLEALNTWDKHTTSRRVGHLPPPAARSARD